MPRIAQGTWVWLGALWSGQPRVKSQLLPVETITLPLWASLDPCGQQTPSAPLSKMVLVPKANFLKVRNMALIPIRSEHMPKSYVIHWYCPVSSEAASKSVRESERFIANGRQNAETGLQSETG